MRWSTDETVFCSMRTALFKAPSDGYGEETVNSQEKKPWVDSDMECRWYFYSGITDIFKYLKITPIHLRISVKDLQISVIELWISVILLQISSIRHNYRYLKLY